MKALLYLESLRNDINQLPEDPFIVYPKEGQSSTHNNKGDLLNIKTHDPDCVTAKCGCAQ